MTESDPLAGIEIPNPLPLRNIPTPPEVSRVEGCDCGGVQWHRAPEWNHSGCSIWSVPPDQRQASVDAAEERMRAFSAALTVKLRAALGQPTETLLSDQESGHLTCGYHPAKVVTTTEQRGQEPRGSRSARQQTVAARRDGGASR